MTPPLPLPDGETTYLYLLRHGATSNNVAQPPRLQGQRDDGPLSAEGLVQSQRTGRFFSSRPLAAVYCSPLLRSRQTAEFLARPHALALATVDALTEVDVGNWEGRAWSEIERSEPEAYRRFIEDAGKYGYAGGETLAEVRDRVVPTFAEILARHAGQAIAAVAHNNVNRVYLAHLMGLPLALARGLVQDTCGINLIRRRGAAVSLVSMNVTFHLGLA